MGRGERGSTSAVDVARGMLPLVPAPTRVAVGKTRHPPNESRCALGLNAGEQARGRAFAAPGAPTAQGTPPTRPGPAMLSAARKIRIVTECSGLEPLPYVFDRLGLAGKCEMAAACEIGPVCGRAIRLCHPGSTRPKQRSGTSSVGDHGNSQTMICMLLGFLANRSRRWELDKGCLMPRTVG